MLAEIFKSVLLMSAAGGILSVVLLCLKPATRRAFSPRWQYYIWLTVLIVLLVPVRFTLPKITPAPQAAEQTRAAVTDGVKTDAEIAVSDNRAEAEPPRSLVEAQPTSPLSGISLPQNIMLYMSALWLIGAIAVLLVKISKYFAFLSAIKKNSYRDDTLPNIPKGLCVRRTDLLDAPLIVGLIRPVLYLPDTELPQESLNYILLHELTHYRRHDLLYKWIAMLALCVHWFNPLIYAVSRHIDSDCETSCDAAAVRGLSEQEQKSYMNMILDMLLRSKSSLRPLTTQMASGKKTLKRRFEIMSGKKKTGEFASVLSAALAVLMLGTTVFASGVLSDMAADDYTVDVIIHGEKTALNNKPFIENGEVYLPLRETLEKWGAMEDETAYIGWDSRKITVYLGDNCEYDDDRYELEIGKNQLIYNPSSELPNSGATRDMNNAPIMKGALTFVPYSYIYCMLNREKRNIDYAVYDKNGNKLNAETLYERTERYLSSEFYRVYSPYYEILDLKISNWTENEDGTEAEFFYTMTEKNYDRNPDEVEYIREARESGNPLYERLKEDYLAPHEGSYEFKVVEEDGGLKLYHNAAPVGVEWQEITVDDFIMR